jgi:hypothetical protein
MAKDRISHFNERITELRISGLPIATAIQGAGLVVAEQLGWHSQAASFLFLFGALFLMPLFTLDQFYFTLLLRSVERAMEIEKKEPFKGNLLITHRLTSTWLSYIHRVTAIMLYVLLMGAGVYLFILSAFWSH